MKIFLSKKQNVFGKTKLLWGKKIVGVFTIIFETKNWAGKKTFEKKNLVKKKKKLFGQGKKNSG